ncbi:MAG: hypothetical protein IT462_09565 [Planctomycetes bacterium]|nr:hypothetical protein [Planctomycetota bacterium]
MKTLFLMAALALGSAPLAAADPTPSRGPNTAKPAPKDPVEKTAVAWEMTEKSALARAAAEKKSVFVFVYIGGG